MRLTWTALQRMGCARVYNAARMMRGLGVFKTETADTEIMRVKHHR